jgi:DnaJ-class molecular chaperone
MAGEGTQAAGPVDGEDRTDASHEPRECMPCRGTGQLISNLGGTSTLVTCPWCVGGGVRVPGVDAQARWREQQASEPAQEDAPASGRSA